MNPGRPHPPSPPLRADPRPLVILLGPTASGKSALAVALAERFGGEVVGADSRQIYRGTAVGTAQPSAPLRARVPHHMVDFLSPSESYNAARFAREARRAIEGIYARGHLPVAAGGSGLYVHALAEGLFEDEGVDSAFREGLSQLARRDGREAVHARLAREDPEAAAAIHPRDLKRVVRALELRRRWGLPLREVRRRRPVCSFEEPLYLGLAWPRELLYGRINRRASAMWEEGLLEETAALVRSGLEAVPAIGPGRESPALLEPPVSVGGTREVGFPGCAVAPALEGLGYR
ncbi:MAG: tRNA (adenosine(37)-N6)-dimethylallyltransferase MiaA, partial [Nitrospinota bacterium]